MSRWRFLIAVVGQVGGVATRANRVLYLCCCPGLCLSIYNFFVLRDILCWEVWAHTDLLGMWTGNADVFGVLGNTHIAFVLQVAPCMPLCVHFSVRTYIASEWPCNRKYLCWHPPLTRRCTIQCAVLYSLYACLPLTLSHVLRCWRRPLFGITKLPHTWACLHQCVVAPRIYVSPWGVGTGHVVISGHA